MKRITNRSQIIIIKVGHLREEVMIDIKEILSLSKGQTDEARGQLDDAIGSLLSKDSLSNRAKKEEAVKTIQTLLSRAAKDVRMLLAERLSMEEDVPLQLMMALAIDEDIEIARPVLKETKKFKDPDWDFVINQTGSEHWCMIADRDDLSEKTMTSILDKEDEASALKIVENTHLQLRPVLMNMLKRLAFRIDKLHVPLLNRHEIDPATATELYWSASESLRHKIVERYELDKRTLDEALENVVQELVNAAHGHHDVTPDLVVMAKRYSDRREITPQFMTKVLRRGQIAFFIALMSRYSGLTVELTRRVIAKKEGDLLAILCRANSIMKSDFATYYLLTRATVSTDYRGNQGDLSSALSIYDRLDRERAREIMQSWSAPKAVT